MSGSFCTSGWGQWIAGIGPGDASGGLTGYEGSAWLKQASEGGGTNTLHEKASSRMS